VTGTNGKRLRLASIQESCGRGISGCFQVHQASTPETVQPRSCPVWTWMGFPGSFPQVVQLTLVRTSLLCQLPQRWHR
jgi:hypothetical protein